MKYLVIIVLVLAFVVVSCRKGKTEGVSLVSPHDAEQFLASNKDVQLVDVRTLEEYDSGHITNAKHIDFYGHDFESTITNLDKSKPIVVYCKSGGRSGKTCKLLKQAGFTEIYDIQGGIVKWKAGGHSVE